MNACRQNFGGFGNWPRFVDYVFNATPIGQKTILTVTGDVFLNIVGVCTVNVVTVGAAGTCSLGIAASVASIIAVTSGDLLAAREIWHDNSPDSEIENYSVVKSVFVTDGNDITLDLLAAAFTSGTIRFYYNYMPLAEGASVA